MVVGSGVVGSGVVGSGDLGVEDQFLLHFHLSAVGAAAYRRPLAFSTSSQMSNSDAVVRASVSTASQLAR